MKSGVINMKAKKIGEIMVENEMAINNQRNIRKKAIGKKMINEIMLLMWQ
jgi:hypothetical protein